MDYPKLNETIREVIDTEPKEISTKEKIKDFLVTLPMVCKITWECFCYCIKHPEILKERSKHDEDIRKAKILLRGMYQTNPNDEQLFYPDVARWKSGIFNAGENK